MGYRTSLWHAQNPHVAELTPQHTMPVDAAAGKQLWDVRSLNQGHSLRC